MAVSAQTVKIVRQRTGAGILESKNALEEVGGNIEKAIQSLREKGIAKGAKLSGKRGDNELNQGLIESYIHTGGRVGVMLELNCETDFVARTEDFKTLAHNIALQIAAMNPAYIGIDDLPDDPTEQDMEASLWNQPFIRDGSVSVKDLVIEAIGKLGENIKLTRFLRYELGTE